MSEVTSISSVFEWNISKIAEALGMSRNTVSKRLRRVNPAGMEKGYPVYALKDAMPAIFENDNVQFEGVIDPNTLTPESRKAWYQSESERIKLEKELGNLCDSADVAREFSLMAKAVVQVLETLPDVLERDCGLTPKQVATVQSKIDDLREQMAAKVAAGDDEIS